MADKLSVVIVCKNEAHIIELVLQSLLTVTDDIVVYDSGSTDGTLEILSNYNVWLHQGEWLGFGKTKNYAATLAKHDWILSIDADEALDGELQNELKEIAFTDGTVYKIRRKNFLGSKQMRWGEWGHDELARLFNRQQVNWNDAEIHEDLIISPDVKVERLRGSLLHYTMRNVDEYSKKMVEYALLNADKYFKKGKRATWAKRYLNPSFSFIKNYFFRLGFLDGWEGLLTARMTAFYTMVKYSRLHELWKEKKSK